ncbi:MAG: site-specific integrase [Akkermansia sp.]|nr:site-specific integrase [Akkermansia sp.]
MNQEDAARLVLEIQEALGPLARTKDRAILMERMRRLIRAGQRELNEPSITVSFARAAAASLKARAGRRPVTLRDLRYYMRRIAQEGGFGRRPLRAITTAECRTLLRSVFGRSKHSYRKARAIMHSVFAYGLRQDWCSRNPVDGIDTPEIPEVPIEPLSIADVHRLEIAARDPDHRAMQLSLHLMLYCGVRPNEVQRIDPARDIDWKHREVLIRPQTSKTGGGRIVPLRKASRVRSDCRETIPRNWSKKWKALRHAAGFRRWRADVCRHTFASYHAQRFRNLPQLQIEMGHRSCDLLRSRYVMARLGQEASEFWK